MWCSTNVDHQLLMKKQHMFFSLFMWIQTYAPISFSIATDHGRDTKFSFMPRHKLKRAVFHVCVSTTKPVLDIFNSTFHYRFLILQISSSLRGSSANKGNIFQEIVNRQKFCWDRTSNETSEEVSQKMSISVPCVLQDWRYMSSMEEHHLNCCVMCPSRKANAIHNLKQCTFEYLQPCL